MKKTVYVVGGDDSVQRMFQQRGWLTVGDQAASKVDVDLVCFTGGSDISPYLYGEENIHSHCDPIRDEFERQVYDKYVTKKPFVGICRGGQFLHVMNGGRMIQHVGQNCLWQVPRLVS